MAAVHSLSENLSRPAILMNRVSSNLRSRIRFCPATLWGSCTLSLYPKDTHRPLCSGRRTALGGLRVSARALDSQLKKDWLDSLSSPFGEPTGAEGDGPRPDAGSGWVVGIDPDVSGALALLKPDPSGCSAQVFDTPYLQVLIGKKVRKRLDARSIVQLLHSFDAPNGTTAYIEQSSPFPQDGKQGWWSGGFNYGLWIGILVALGISVVPVPSRLWKDQFELFRNSSTKDDSRKAASILFPSLSSSLKRKKDHGRAEALLIAAYGKGLKNQPTLSAV